MPTREKILMRKIMKLGKKKRALMTVKNLENPQTEEKKKNKVEEEIEESESQASAEETEDIEREESKTDDATYRTNGDIESRKRTSEEGEKLSSKKKKKKKVKKEIEETESQASAEETEDIKEEIKTDDTTLTGSSLCNGIPSNTEFSSLEGQVCEATLRAIKDMGFTKMTEIQAKAIPPLLKGRDLVGAARTGSGKTLAFLIPAIELIYKMKFKMRNGTGCIILSPTRELAMQTFGVLNELMTHHHHTYGLIMGGANRSIEEKKLSNGMNIVVATPGRLLDHLQNTPDFLYKNLHCLVIDEADRILEIGFEEEVKQILRMLPKVRQTMLFSATQTEKTEALTALAFRHKPLYIGVDDIKKVATVDSLEQGYLVCPPEKRMNFLLKFLRKNRDKKVMVFFSTCLSVKYHHDLFNFIDVPVMCIHGKQEQNVRTTAFFKFCNADTGVLLCTDVAARGLDIPAVDWIVQYDPPDDPKEYIHRVGRTARGLGASGHALLILRPEELGFLRYLKQARVPLNEFDVKWEKIPDIQTEIEKVIKNNYYLKQCAKEALQSYVRAYNSHHLKTIFDMNTLDLAKVAKSFGFAFPPAIELHGTSKKRKGGRGDQRNSKNNFYKREK